MSTNVKQLIQEAHAQIQPDCKNMDSLVNVVSSYIQNGIKSDEKHRDMYPDTADMKSIDHNLAILPNFLLLQIASKVKLQIFEARRSAKPS